MFLNNIIFVHPPRSGGTSIEQSFGWRDEQQKHLSASSIRKIIGEDLWSRSFKFSIVRNPFDRAVSMYCAPWYKNIRKGINFETFESFLYFLPRVPTEEGIQCSDFINEDIDFIIRYENRDSDLDKIYKQFGIKIDKNIHVRQTNRYKNYKLYHNDNTIELVKLRFKDDIKRFCYSY